MAADVDAGVMDMTAEFVMFEHSSGGFLFDPRWTTLAGAEHRSLSIDLSYDDHN